MKIIASIAACAIMATATPAFSTGSKTEVKVARMAEGRASAAYRHRRVVGHHHSYGYYGSFGGYNSANGGYENGNMAPGGGPGIHD